MAAAAVSGAHLHSHELVEEGTRPDIFQVVSQESLAQTLHPAFDHICKIVTSRFPAKLGWLYQWRDEIFLVLDMILEKQSLSLFDASFAENFYGLKRVPLNSTTFSKHLKTYNLLLLTLVPYLLRKAEKWYEQLKVDESTQVTPNYNESIKIVKAFLYSFPFMHALWESLVTWYYLRYLFNMSDVHSPLHKLSLVRLVNLSVKDDELDEPSWSNIWKISGFVQRVTFIIRKLSVESPKAALRVFSTSIFFLQFLQWWHTYQTDTSHSQSLSMHSNIPAPKRRLTSNMNDVICPICHKTRTNATVVSTSGYVFCYPCIYKHVQANHTCPVTGFTARLEHLIRLYPPED